MLVCLKNAELFCHSSKKIKRLNIGKSHKSISMEKELYQNYNAFVTPHGNIVWAAAMQLAWNQLKTSFAHDKPLKFQTENIEALKIITNFNNSVVKKGIVSEDSVYVKSGYGMKTIDLINKEVKEKFPKKQLPSIKGPLSDDGIVSYAYLFKKIKFVVKFERRKLKSLKFNNVLVESFYADNPKQLQQIKCYSYENQHNFVVQLKGNVEKESLILIKSSKILSVDEAIKLSNTKVINGKGVSLKKTDSFQMPLIKLKSVRNYNEMVNLSFQNPQLTKYIIQVMTEWVNLDIDECGAKVENQAVIIAERSKCIPVEQPKKIILDSTFWIIMQQNGKHPYLAVCINAANDDCS